MADDSGVCLDFIRKGPSDPGGVMFCRRCGLHVEIHPIAEPDAPEAVICDLDGTLADVSPVRHLVQRRPGVRRDFHGFHHYAVTQAAPIEGTVRAVAEHKAAGRRVLLVSGRHDRWRADTVAWLADAGVPWDHLWMRADGDFRSDVNVKRDIWERHIVGRYRVVECYDDRPSIVRLWESLGLPVTVVAGWTE